jgi:hypothetical protein
MMLEFDATNKLLKIETNTFGDYPILRQAQLLPLE